MAERIASARAELESNLALLTLSGDGVMIGLAEAQLGVLNGLQRRVDQAGSADLVAVRNEVIAVAAAAQVAAQQARCSPAMAVGLSIQEASERARKSVLGTVDDYYEKKKLDPYLHFASAEEEAAFRKREAERKAVIDTALAAGTPEGNLTALKLMEDQIRDAGAHGADRSPDYGPMLSKVTEAENDLGSAIAAQKAPAKVATADPLDAIAPATPVAVSDTTEAGHGVSIGAPTGAPGRVT